MAEETSRSLNSHRAFHLRVQSHRHFPNRNIVMDERRAMEKKKVLITGAAGRIGGIVRQFLGQKYELSALDIVAVDDIPSRVADLADIDSIMSAFEGQDTVVHLGADPSGGAPWDSVLPNNIVGMYNVMEACRAGGRQAGRLCQHQPRGRLLPGKGRPLQGGLRRPARRRPEVIPFADRREDSARLPLRRQQGLR